MNCPLCDYKGLADDAKNCPSCNADLSAYRALDTVEHAMEKQKKRTLLFIILFFIAFMGCFAVYFIFNSGNGSEATEESATTNLAAEQAFEAENAKLQADLEKIKNENAQLKKELKTAKENQLITHTIVEGETLYIIAEKYLGDGNKYLKLAADNHIEDPDMIVVGTKLIIFK